MKQAARSLLTIIALALSVVGCGGGSSGDLGLPSGNPGASASGSINAGLTGRLITTKSFEPYQVDLATGAMSALPLDSGIEYFRNRPETENLLPVSYFAAGDGSPNQGYVEMLYNCLTTPAGSCLSVYDNNLQVVSRIEVPERTLDEPAKLSPSGRYVVMGGVSGFSQDISIEIVDLDTVAVVDFSQYDSALLARAPVVEWGPDDEIYYSLTADVPATVYVTEPASLDVVRTIRFPESYTGRINGLDIHPNGDRLLIEYRALNDGSHSIILVLDLNTLSLSIPAINEIDANTDPIGDDFASQFRNPAWSPDGEHIIFLNSSTAGGSSPVAAPGVDSGGQCMIAVSADSSRTIVNDCISNTRSPLPGGSPAVVIQVQSSTVGQFSTRWPFSNSVNKGHIEWIE